MSTFRQSLAAASKRLATGGRSPGGAPPPGGPQGVFDLNGSPVTAIATDTAGIVLLPGKSYQIPDAVIAPGGAATTLWTLAVAASQNVTVEAVLSASADDGATGGHLDGTIVCTAKRFKSGALAITAQSAALPWALNKTAWLPQFVTSSNNLLLQITPDATATIQLRDSSVRYSVKSTSGDVEPVAQNFTWLAAAVSTLLGSKIIDQWEDPSKVGVNGNTLVSIGAGTYTATTMGSNARSAITATSAIEGCLAKTDVGQAVKAMVSVCVIPTFPDAVNYQVLMGTAGSLAANVQSGQTLLLTNTWTTYVNNVSTHALPAAGSIATIRAELAAHTEQSVRVGFSGATFSWRAAHGYLLALNAGLTAGEAESLESLLQGFYA